METQIGSVVIFWRGEVKREACTVYQNFSKGRLSTWSVEWRDWAGTSGHNRCISEIFFITVCSELYSFGNYVWTNSGQAILASNSEESDEGGAQPPRKKLRSSTCSVITNPTMQQQVSWLILYWSISSGTIFLLCAGQEWLFLQGFAQ